MEIDSKKTHEVKGMFKGSITSLIVKLSLPVVAGMIFQLFYNIIDAVFISLIDKSDPSYFGGTGIVFPIIFLAIAIANGLMVGTSSLVARAIGEKNHKILDMTAESGIAVAVVSSIVLMLGIYIFGDSIIKGLGAEGDYAIHAAEYLYYIIPCGFFIFIGNVLLGILQGEGQMKYLMISMILGTLINIILDWFMIFILGWGVKGAALATVIAQACSVFYVLYIFIAKKTSITIAWKLSNIKMFVIKDIVTVGFPQALGQIFMSLSFFIFNRIVVSIDPLAFTAFSLYGRFEQVLYIPIFAVNSSLITIIGQNVGRKNYQRGEDAWLRGVILSLSMVTVLAVPFFFLSPFIFGSMSDIPQVVDYAVRQTHVMVFSALTAVFGILGRAAFQAMGKPLPALIITILRVLVLAVPAVLVLVYLFNWGMYGVWFGILTGNLLASVLSYFMTRHTFTQLKKGELILSEV